MITSTWNSFILVDSNGMISDIDKLLDQGGVTDDVLLSRMEDMKQLQELNSSVNCDFVQKAKVRWAIEGDKNSKFFHGIINRKRANLSVKGMSINLKKSHILGLGIRGWIVSEAATSLGCSMMKTPFNYLGIMVGGHGRLTTPKIGSWLHSDLNMSIFKVPKTVLFVPHCMLRYRRKRYIGSPDKLQSPLVLRLRRMLEED
ncbi:hypothetical protein Tco_1325298 [Tanacetum coccineum]